MFIKIDHKIVLKINDIKITNDKNYEKQVLNIHRTILAIMKVFNIFQKVEINNLTLFSYKINYIQLNKHFLILKSDLANLNAVVNPNIKNSYINVIKLTIPKYNLTLYNSVFNFYFNPESIVLNSKIYLDKNRLSLKGELKNNILTLHLFAKKLQNISLPHLRIKDAYNISADTALDLNTLNFNFDILIPSITAVYKNNTLVANDVEIKNDSYANINIFAKNLYIPKTNLIKNLENIYIQETHLTYNYKHPYTDVQNGSVLFNYKDLNVIISKNRLTFTNLDNLNFTNSFVKISNKDYTVKLKNILLNKLGGKYNYTVEKTLLKHKDFNLSTAPVYGNLNSLKTKYIKGIVYKRTLEANNILFDIKKRYLKIKTLKYNNIPVENITANEKQITLYSKTLLNDNIKDLLKQFLNLELPIKQIAGYNDINTTVDIKNRDFKTVVKSRYSLFKLFDFDLFSKSLKTDIDMHKLIFETNNSVLHLTKDISLTYSGNGTIVYKNQNLVLNGTIDKFSIENVINLQNYKEFAVVDFKNQKLVTKNSSLLIDFARKELIISPLSNILYYTPFNNYVKDGILMMRFSPLEIYTFLKLSLPVLYKHSNAPIKDLNKYMYNLIEDIYLSISINNNINIQNKNIKVTISDKKIDANISDIDFNISPLEDYLKESNTTVKQSEEKKEFNKVITIHTNNCNFIYKNHKFLSQKAYLEYNRSKIKFKSFYKSSSIEGYTKQKYLLLEGKNFDKKLFEAFLPSMTFFKEINTDFLLVKSPDDFYTGKIYINHAIVKELKTLNNVIAFINTIPSLLSFSSPGFSAKGYKIKKGYINYLLYKKILYIKQADIYGDNLDFFAKGYIDLNKNYIFLKITANMKMKLKKIPIIGKGLSYLLFGKDGSIDIKMVVKGDLSNPEVKEDIGKDILLSPFKLFKRAITLPFNLF